MTRLINTPKPMSIQRRLWLSLLGSFLMLWSVAAVWLLQDLQAQMKHTLDQRLAASARLVAGVLDQLPQDALTNRQLNPSSLVNNLDGVACQVRWQNGELLLRTADNMDGLLQAPQLGFSERRFEGVDWRLYTIEHGDLVITTADRMSERDALYQGILVAVAGPVLIALLGMLAAIWWSIKRGLQPLVTIGHTLRQRQPEVLTPIQMDLPQEIEPLLSSLNQLLERIAGLVEREQRFTSDAAHELRTPLTAIKTNLQLARQLDSQLSTAERNEVLHEANAAASRMQQVIEQLLTLARLDAAAPEAAAQTVALATDIIEQALADFDELSQLQICGDLSLQFPLDKAIAAVALRNLIDNAFSHGGQQQQQARVDIAAVRCGDSHCLSVRDYGTGLPSEHIKQVTERFWRANHSKQGSGLGLAIVEQVCKQTGGKFELRAAQPGLEARLCWPCGKAKNGNGGANKVNLR